MAGGTAGNRALARGLCWGVWCQGIFPVAVGELGTGPCREGRVPGSPVITRSIESQRDGAWGRCSAPCVCPAGTRARASHDTLRQASMAPLGLARGQRHPAHTGSAQPLPAQGGVTPGRDQLGPLLAPNPPSCGLPHSGAACCRGWVPTAQHLGWSLERAPVGAKRCRGTRRTFHTLCRAVHDAGPRSLPGSCSFLLLGSSLCLVL